MLTLPRSLTFTPSQFAQVCAANPEAVLELDADGTLTEMTPTGGASGARYQTLGALLWLAIEQGPPAAEAVRQLHGLPAPRSRKASPKELAPYAAPTPAWCGWIVGRR
jgi:Uma2 family endonuclease